MQTIRNSNGNEYRIIDTTGNYILLENITFKGKGFDKFVVAYNCQGESWQHGNYFATLEEAQEYFESKKETR